MDIFFVRCLALLAVVGIFRFLNKKLDKWAEKTDIDKKKADGDSDDL